MKKRKLLYLASFLVFLCGLIAFTYPVIRDFLYHYTIEMEIDSYNVAVSEKDNEELNNIKEQAENYNNKLGGNANAESVVSYNELLAVTDAIGYLEIPVIDVRLPIYHGVEEEILQRGIGHLENTSLPIGGVSSHCALSGHSGLASARLLTDLQNMNEGDYFFLYVLDEILAYQVDKISVVLPHDTSELTIFENKDYVTLITCTPYGINTHRLLVRGERTDTKSALEEVYGTSNINVEDKSETLSPVILIICSIGIVFIVVLVIILIWRWPNRKNSK